jgi:UTP--glucose-1-phosphate uridylyltransferase
LNGPNEQQLAFLRQYGFDAELQKRWQQDVAAGRLSKAGNAITGELLAPPPSALKKLPGSQTKAARELERIGREALQKGEVGVVVLNGGMATRFGGVVKGVVPVLGKERSFLALAVEDCRKHPSAAGASVPLFLMNSFATDAATKAHFVQHGHFGAEEARIHHFTQSIALRMTQRRDLFKLHNGELSPYGPGHGDFPSSFRRAGLLQSFLAAGGRWLLVRNVDNVGARIDPLILGHHIKSGMAATCELAPKWPEDVGGSPFSYLGQTQLVEQIRFPADFDPSIVDVFNTNTFTFRAEALDRDFDLGWYFVEKTVEEKKAVQVEHLIGEMTAHLPTGYLCVRRSGQKSRFLPMKTPDDLNGARDEIAEMYDAPPEAG